MFNKKSKNSHPLPSVPTTDEIFSDLETFQIPTTIVQHKTKVTDDTFNAQSLQDWWNRFETVVSDVKDLAALNDELKRKQSALGEFTTNIEKEANTLRDDLNEKIIQINNALDKQN